MIAFKFLRGGRVGPFSHVRWPAPAGDAPGSWVLRAGAGAGGVCAQRVHACRINDLPEWIDTELWTVELDGDIDVQCGKLVADRGRLLAPVDAWDAAAATELAAACALRARDAAITLLGPGAQADALSAHAGPRDRGDRGDRERARRRRRPRVRLCRRRRAARDDRAHAARDGARSRGHRGVHRPHAAALAAGDRGAADGERAWQASRLADRLDLAS